MSQPSQLTLLANLVKLEPAHEEACHSASPSHSALQNQPLMVRMDCCVLGADADLLEGPNGEELHHDAMSNKEVPNGAGFDDFDHMMGKGSPATRARRLELVGKHVKWSS